MTGESEKVHCFKVENKFIVKSGCKKRIWRSLKQILAADRALPWPNDAVLCESIILISNPLNKSNITLRDYFMKKLAALTQEVCARPLCLGSKAVGSVSDLSDYSINAPPTFKPTKKYSDISGLPAPYVDRHSKLYYSNADEFSTVRSLPMDITAGYLQLRGATTIVG